LAESKALKVLVVDDSADISRLLDHILTQAGYQVTVADNGEAGWATFQRLRPAICLLDVNMPGIDGLELCRRIKQTSSTPVILLTVRAEIEAVQQGRRAGADAYLSKPFEIGRLMATVEHVLRGSQLSRLARGKEEESAREGVNR